MLYANGLKKITVKRRWVNTGRHFRTKLEYMNQTLSRLFAFHESHELSLETEDLNLGTILKNECIILAKIISLPLPNCLKFLFMNTSEDLHWVTEATFMSEHANVIITYMFVPCYSSHM
jgi:hypothetical protein